jgi:hypothetical protein
MADYGESRSQDKRLEAQGKPKRATPSAGPSELFTVEEVRELYMGTFIIDAPPHLIKELRDRTNALALTKLRDREKALVELAIEMGQDCMRGEPMKTCINEKCGQGLLSYWRRCHMCGTVQPKIAPRRKRPTVESVLAEFAHREAERGRIPLPTLPASHPEDIPYEED